MILLIIIAASILAVSNSIDEVEKFVPHLETMLSSIETVGTYHTDAFSRLADLYSRQERRPNSRPELQRDVNDIVRSYCSSSSSSSSLMITEEEEQRCVSHVQRVVDAEFRRSEQPQPPQSMTIPDDLDPELRQILTELHDIMDTTQQPKSDDDTNNTIMVLEELVSDLQTRVQRYQHDDNETNNHNYYYKIAILGGVAVALESCRMWHEVYANADHPLYGLHSEDGSFYIQTPPHERRRRRLQNPYEGLQPQVIARADVVTAISIVMNNLLDSLADLNTFLLIAAIVVPIAAAGSVAASAAFITNYEKPETDAPTMSNAPSSSVNSTTSLMPSVMT